MKRYDTYKDSGVQWLGEIPGHWECVPLKYLIETKSGTAINAKEFDDRGTYPVYGGGSQIGFCNKYNCDESEIIVGRVGAKCGCVTFPNKKVWATDNALIIKTNLYPRFTAFVLEAADLNRLNAANAQPLITGTKIKKVRIALPEESEQHSIVSFLDTKCGKIDEWVNKKQKEVEHLQELKQRVIADAVTRGLNPHVKMKTTNIPWLKEIPEHWECVPLKYFIETKSGTAINVKELDDKGTYPVYGGGSQIGFCNKYNCEESEIIVGRVGAKCGCVTFPNKKVCATDNALIIKTNLYPRFTAFVLVAADLNRLNAATAQPLITGTKIKHVRIALPPLSEQKQIVSYLDAKCSKINKLIANVTKEIECIKEYKQRLISDVVTGQIKVC